MAKISRSRRSKKRGRPRLEALFARYEIQITSWDFSWSFYLSDPKDRWQGKSHFKEMATLTLKGRVVEPEGFKYPEALLRVVADPWLDTLIEQPAAIGSVHINNNQFTGYVCSQQSDAYAGECGESTVVCRAQRSTVEVSQGIDQRAPFEYVARIIRSQAN